MLPYSAFSFTAQSSRKEIALHLISAAVGCCLLLAECVHAYADSLSYGGIELIYMEKQLYTVLKSSLFSLGFFNFLCRLWLSKMCGSCLHAPVHRSLRAYKLGVAA